MEIIRNIIMENYNAFATIGVSVFLITIMFTLYVIIHLVKKSLIKCIRKHVKKHRKGS